MAAKIGILGESTVVTQGATTTIYTVPADKAARVQILYMIEGADPSSNHSALRVRIGSPGTENTLNHMPSGAVADTWTGKLANTTPDPAAAVNGLDGLMDKVDGLGNMDADATQKKYIVAPLNSSYFLSTGDTVIMHLQGADANDLLIQVIGVEDDA
jgi:hypothetical protein